MIDAETIARLGMLVDRALSFLNAVDENKPEQVIRLVDTARDDVLEVRRKLAESLQEL